MLDGLQILWGKDDGIYNPHELRHALYGKPIDQNAFFSIPLQRGFHFARVALFLVFAKIPAKPLPSRTIWALEAPLKDFPQER